MGNKIANAKGGRFLNDLNGLCECLSSTITTQVHARWYSSSPCEYNIIIII